MNSPILSKINLVRLGHCPACQARSKPHPKFLLSRTNVFDCPACGLEYIDPSLDAASMIRIYSSPELLRQINPALENYYEYDVLKEGSLTYKDYVRALTDLKRLAPGSELLEVGCGGGGFLDFARSYGWRVTGLDSGASNIEKVKQRGIDGICSDYLDYAGTRKFDAIVLWDLIEHPQDPRAYLEKSFQMLNPNGILLIATPHYPNILSVIAGILYRLTGGKLLNFVEKMYFLEHTTYFGFLTITPLLRTTGFEITHQWKTETDLERYHLASAMKFILRLLFFTARLFNLENRCIVYARKKI